MKKSLLILILCWLGVGLLFAQENPPQAAFVPNQGQWPGNFDYKTRLHSGSLFFTETGFSILLHQGGGHSRAHTPGAGMDQSGTASIDMQWVHSKPYTVLEPFGELAYYHNYFLGSDTSRWKGQVPVYGGLRYRDIYPGISLSYYSQEGMLKYDIEIEPGADPAQLLMKFEGMDSYSLEEGNLVLRTPIGEIREWIPAAYQLLDGKKVPIHCEYRITEKGVGFRLDHYDRNHAVVIDPILDFSTFSGSYADNWGYTATYGKDGSFYGGGIARQDSFPTTTGVFQRNFGGTVDVTINKFSEDGSQLLYASFLGGSGIETPHSMVVNAQGELIVLGNTGSNDFPVKTNAYQTVYSPGPALTDVSSFTFPGIDYPTGSNIFICKLSANGSQLLGGTYLGGDVAEGVNNKIYKNYGDYSRGEVIIMPGGDVAITSNSKSTDLPFDNTGATLGNNIQNAIVAVFNSALSQLRWGRYYGSSAEETGYSIRTDGSDIFISGTTTGSGLITTTSAFQSTSAGGWDGFIAKFNGTTGAFMEATHIGSTGRDQAFLIDIDKQGKVYTLGQTSGSFPTSPGIYSNPNSSQFIQKYSNDLSTQEWGTLVGSGQSKSDLIPTAFMVDQCFNIYLSGWNGLSNIEAPSFAQANTNALPVTADAFQSTTDGSDFYFMVLSRNAQSLLFASYFGGSSHEHVDGGTSRFSPKGIVYQAACAGCSGLNFPTTPTSYSPTKPSNNCNFGAIKIDFEQTVRSLPDVDFDADVDTICDNLEVTFSNNSLHANQFIWDFGNGLSSTQSTPSTVFTNFGKYTVTLVAIDTVCDISDTNTIEINHQAGVKPKASFSSDYIGCDNTYQVRFSNLSKNAQQYVWLFGDGGKSQRENPTHSFPDSGSYRIILLAYDSVCNQVDTSFGKVTFKDTTVAPEGMLWHPECAHGRLEVKLSNARSRYVYDWDYPGGMASGAEPEIVLTQTGNQLVHLEVYDSICRKTYDMDFKVFVDQLLQKTFVPNAFTPNQDGLNDRFLITGDNCSESAALRIFDRWGQMIFSTTRPFEDFWDGRLGGKKASMGVYTYILINGEKSQKGTVILIR